MVGIVVVSHSRRIAEGVVELAREMGGREVAIEAAGGTDEPDALGTDALRVLASIERAFADDGVLVLMDLGSAVMSAEMAVEMLDEDRRGRVRLCEAPLVEGAVAAATAAKLGRSVDEVADEARAGLAGKAAHLGVEPDATAAPPGREASYAGQPLAEVEIVVTNPLGLHARPAARFVGTAGGRDASVEVENLTTNRGPVDGTSLSALTTLGVSHDHTIAVRVRGRNAPAVIADLERLAADNFGDPVEAGPEDSAIRRPREPVAEGGLAGLPASPGVAVAPARHLHRRTPEIPAVAAGDARVELELLEKATAAARADIGALRERVARSAGEYEAQIFDAHLLILEDARIQGEIRTLVLEEGRNAAHATWSVIDNLAEEFETGSGSQRLRERAQDVRDVGGRVVAHLLGETTSTVHMDAPGILIVPELAPSDAASLDPAMVRAVATARGGPTSHGAILARALGVPAVVGLGEGILDVAEGSEIAVDGDSGLAIIDPDEDTAVIYREKAAAQEEERRTAGAAAREPGATADGTRIEIAANIGSVEDVRRALEAGADGVGLLRTEFLFLDRADMPTEDEQYAIYLEIARALGGRPLTIRTVDAGADKPLPYVDQVREENPFLGVRGIRLALSRPELLSAQLRAIARVAESHPLRLMFPMITTRAELKAARALLENAPAAKGATGLEVGIMIEVPAAALNAARFAPHVDFFSIGTNDLSQYTMAAERGNARVAALADPLDPAVLALIAQTVAAAGAHGRWVGVCGELAGDARAAPLLVGLGITELSMAAPAIPVVKQAVRSVSAESARLMAKRALESESAAEVRSFLEEGDRAS